jgi:hypothetical protein
MACCQSNFTSDIYNIPNCAVACLSAAQPGATFVGADGSVWILTGDDPCNTADWQTQGNCCLRFSSGSGFTDICCNEIVNFTSADGSVTVTITDGVIDFSVAGMTPLPVALFYYTTVPLGGSLNGNPSTSTQDGVTITHAWTASGPGTVTFSNPASPNPSFTVTEPGLYTFTLTVTDSNGATNSFQQTFCVLAVDGCITYQAIPNTAFADVDNPTDAEALGWVNTNGPWNCGTAFWFGGTAVSPDFVWEYK